MAQTCGTCPKPTNDGIHLCAECRDLLIADLETVEATVEAIWASAARMNVGSGSVGTSGHATPGEPTNSRAYDTGRTLNVILTGWVRALGHHQPHAVKAAHTLLQHIGDVRRQDWAPVLKQELADALADCERATDRKARRVFAGTCPTTIEDQECGTPVYTPEGTTEAKCQTCGTTWDLTEWRVMALDAAGYYVGTPAEVSRMLSDPVSGYALPQGTIRQWINRGKLAPIGENHLGRSVYQVRKVRNLWKRSPSYGRTLAA